MQVFVVAETDYDHYHQHGIFSELAQAQAYVAMVEVSEAEQQEGDGRGRVWGNLSIETVELDALVGAYPVFDAYPGDGDGEASLFDYGHLPQPPVMFSAEKPPRLIAAFGRTPEEARANLDKASEVGAREDRSGV